MSERLNTSKWKTLVTKFGTEKPIIIRRKLEQFCEITLSDMSEIENKWKVTISVYIEDRRIERNFSSKIEQNFYKKHAGENIEDMIPWAETQTKKYLQSLDEIIHTAMTNLKEA